jgi:hypothetical protein
VPVYPAGGSRSAPSRPPFELADIIRDHAEALRAQQAVTPEQGKVLRDLAACRTAALGGHLDRCLDCGHERPAYNSCRNRHCPKCQALEQARWLARRMETLLPIPYFHVVFTLPGELSAMVLRNRRRLFGLLFRAASQTLLALGRDPDRLGAQLGITMVLHTWTRDQRFHPHVHALVTGGGLSLDGERWVQGNARYLFPVKVLSRLFRGKMLAGLRREHEQEELDLPEDLCSARRFSRLMSRLYKTNWVTYAKAPFAGPRQVLAYLGRYTHRVALSNHRLLELTHDHVTLRTRGQQSVTLHPQELLRRFLLHVLPSGFVRIRHYGILASGNLKTKLLTAQRLLGVATIDAGAPSTSAEQLPAKEMSTPDEAPQSQAPAAGIDWRDLLQKLTGIDTTGCPLCGSEAWIRLPLGAALPIRAPPREEAL